VSLSKSARELIPVAARRASEIVHEIPPDRWVAPTPCTEWTVRDVVNHLVSEHLWAPHLLRGETIESVGDRYDGDVVGEDPVTAWDRAVQASTSAFENADNEMPVHLSFGTVPVEEYANQMLVDLTVHAWDIARGAGLAEGLEPSTVAASLAYASLRQDAYSGSGLFAEPVAVPSDDPQDRLLAMLGRDPR
jgi:uncharacterized protein (TIGR03086 family)